MTNDTDTAKWDVFICHASEDKDSIARPLADVLSKRGLKVWYDEFSLSLGDSLRRSIDYGLHHSSFGVVILSRSFFEKEWPQRELDGLAAKEAFHKGTTILPIWHCIKRDEIEKFSPVLADKIAISTKHGLSAVADGIGRVVGLSSKGYKDERRRLVASKWIWSGKPNDF